MQESILKKIAAKNLEEFKISAKKSGKGISFTTFNTQMKPELR